MTSLLSCDVHRLAGVAPFQSRDEDKLYELIKSHDIEQHMKTDAKWAMKSQEGSNPNLSQRHCHELNV